MYISSKNECIQKRLYETKYLSFQIKVDELLEKYNDIREKVKNNVRKEFDSKPVYNEKYLKAAKSKTCLVFNSF